MLELLEADERYTLDVLYGGTTILPRFGKPYLDWTEYDDYCVVYHEVEGSCDRSMAKSVGLGVIEYTTAIAASAPDAVLIIGDRYEALAAAVAAHYLRIPIIHLQGGEVSGALDDGARRAITQLAS